MRICQNNTKKNLKKGGKLFVGQNVYIILESVKMFFLNGNWIIWLIMKMLKKEWIRINEKTDGVYMRETGLKVIDIRSYTVTTINSDLSSNLDKKDFIDILE